jgi:hypothetical protein
MNKQTKQLLQEISVEKMMKNKHWKDDEKASRKIVAWNKH